MPRPAAATARSFFHARPRKAAMPEELRDDSLSFKAKSDPATMAAWQESTELLDHVVEDVNGRRIGRVLKCFAEEGMLTHCEVKVDANAKGVFGADRDVAPVPSTWIARVEGDRIRLNKAGEQVLRPEDPRPMGASDDPRGAPDLPRKNR